jgi:hypothetical protein
MCDLELKETVPQVLTQTLLGNVTLNWSPIIFEIFGINSSHTIIFMPNIFSLSVWNSNVYLIWQPYLQDLTSNTEINIEAVI